MEKDGLGSKGLPYEDINLNKKVTRAASVTFISLDTVRALEGEKLSHSHLTPHSPLPIFPCLVHVWPCLPRGLVVIQGRLGGEQGSGPAGESQFQTHCLEAARPTVQGKTSVTAVSL